MQILYTIFSIMTFRNSKDADLDMDRQQVKYDAESIELIIDQLFDVPY